MALWLHALCVCGRLRIAAGVATQCDLRFSHLSPLAVGHAGPVQDGHGEAGHPPVARLRLPLRQPGSQGGTAPVSARSGVSSATPTDSSHASPRVGRTEGSGAEGPRPGDSSDATEEIEVEPEIFFRVR